jgi:uncharacterized protein (TIGR03790 family)
MNFDYTIGKMTSPGAACRSRGALALVLASVVPLHPAGPGTSGPENVLLIVNTNSSLSRSIAEYYARRRSIPPANICAVRALEQETISRASFDSTIASPISACLTSKRLTESILYIVTTQGVPLRVEGTGSPTGTAASVDSELTLLYSNLHGRKTTSDGPLPNPFYRQQDANFRHPQFPMYLVTRLAAYDLASVKALIDRSLAAKNAGKVVFDLRESGRDRSGDEWLRNAAILLPGNRVSLEETSTVVYGQKGVIGYASWGSNDPNRKKRRLGFEWLPGAIATEYVSTNGRTFARPPETWELGTWSDKGTWFGGAPQTLTADLIADGATGASGHVYEPYLHLTPRPDYLFPAYLGGRNLAESYYLAIPALSWQNIVIGDPLCTLR